MLFLIVRDDDRAARIFSAYGIRGEIIPLDLRRASHVDRTLRTIRPSIIFNLAGYGVDPSERDELTAFQINAHLLGTIYAAVASQRPDWCGPAVVHVGSALEYGAIGGNLHEDACPAPSTLYGRSKLAGTRLAARACQGLPMTGVTARLFTVYGPGEHSGRLLPSLLETARTRAPLALTGGHQRRDFVYVEDVAEGLARLGRAHVRPGEVVNLATGCLTTVRSFAETAAELLELPTSLLQFGALPTRADEMDHADVAVERLQSLTGWLPPTPPVDGIRKTIQFDRCAINPALAAAAQPPSCRLEAAPT
jgi:nucleoside-diphosphate-sugar epimerase